LPAFRVHVQDVYSNNEFNLALRKAIPGLGLEALGHFKKMVPPRPDRPCFWCVAYIHL